MEVSAIYCPDLSPKEERPLIRDITIAVEAHPKEGDTFYLITHRNDLPLDLTKGVLQALCVQALGKGVDVKLGIAIDSPKTTLVVRQLACEMVKYRVATAAVHRKTCEGRFATVQRNACKSGFAIVHRNAREGGFARKRW